jgi:hypothetical protein
MPTFLALESERFVALTTFRRDGTPVTTPVWIARDGDDLLVTTPSDSGKVKRLRRDDSVRLQPCSRVGRIKPGTVIQTGRAAIQSEADEQRQAGRFREKYGLEYRLFLVVERIMKRGNAPRLLLRIRPD